MLANARYYATRDPLGTAGDFITAPEISQMFGEMIGLWLADIWARAGGPVDAAYVELGPGRGTLAADALRAMGHAGCRPSVHLVETSPTLRAAQAGVVPGATFYDSVASLPADVPLMIVANEFFDALPVRQFLRTEAGWRERMVMNDRAEWGRRFLPILGDDDCRAALQPQLGDAGQGSVVETCPAAMDVMAALSARLRVQGGVILAIDYGYAGPATGDSVQAVQAHRFADPFVDPGERDLTAHVDFTPLAAAAAGLTVSPLATQGAFLTRIGIRARADALARRNPAAQQVVHEALDRLIGPAKMGQLFKVMAARHNDWPQPEGFG